MSDPSLPPPQLLARQAEWLAPARSRLLRRVHVARRRRVLDLGCGSGAVTAELVRRSGGTVVALDRSFDALCTACHGHLARDSGGGTGETPVAPNAVAPGARRVCGDAVRLPFGDASFDLVFCQFALLWMEAAAVLAEVRRVLMPGGVLVAVEPDYGGLVEYPPEIATRDLWLPALRRAGADPEIGRKLPGLLVELGFDVRVDLLDRLAAPAAERFELLAGLPLEPAERETLAGIRRADAKAFDAGRVAHLPVFLCTATRPG